jgi:YidC/Oxa1 family membrane protein insertase
MDRRTLLALLLTAIVIVITPMLFRSPRRQPTPTDTLTAARPDTTRDTVPTPAAQPSPPTQPARPATTQPSVGVATAPPPVRAETTLVRTEHAEYAIVSPGGTPVNVTLPAYRSLRPGAAADAPVRLLEPEDRLFRLTLASDRDTIALDTVMFRAEPQRREGGVVVQPLVSTSSAVPIALTYRFVTDSFVVRLEGSFGGPAIAGRRLLVTLPTRIRSDEADVGDDTRHLAIAFSNRPNEVENVPFRDLDTLVARVDTGTIRWFSARNKYFVVAVVPAGPDSAFRAIVSRGGARTSSEATAAMTTAYLPLGSPNFALRIYAGPQSWDHLRKTAPALENVNPYGGWMHGLVQPFATIVMRMLLWMRHTFDVSYGWVLVIFGVAVRLLLWPLNQNAMRSSMKMQRLQPELAEIQKKFRDNPERQRDAIMKVYQDHGMSPFTPLLGCLPMLLPMPILFALYFVFQNTIEFRGVPFMWLPDLALKDPFYITPLFMGASMFVLSWIGMRGVPPTPQGKMMSYVMPVMFTVLFWNFASGLNLYYAVQNVAALPQQWLLARERTSNKAPEPSKGTKRDKK